MIKFEKKYLYTFADVEEAKKLIGKKGLFSNTYINETELMKRDLTTLVNVLNKPFDSGRAFCSDKYQYIQHQFFYFDPNLECKRAFYLDGKEIQSRVKNGACKDWYNCHHPMWDDGIEYRIKPEETHLSNRELSMWLAKGNGQARPIGTNQIITSFTYLDRVENEPCVFEIRKWSDSEWHEPTKEYIEDEE